MAGSHSTQRDIVLQSYNTADLSARLWGDRIAAPLRMEVLLCCE